MNEYIKKYIDQGFFVFPCHRDKTPVTMSGFYDAVCDYEKACKQFYSDDLYIGFPTGRRNRLVVVDFDINKKIPGTEEIDSRTIDELYEEIIQNYGDLPDTVQVETPSGGRHYYYAISCDCEIKSGNRFLDRAMPVDLKAEGGYVIAPDGINYIVYDDYDGKEVSDLLNRCAPLPEWIVERRKNRPDNNPENLPEAVLPESEVREIRSALSFMSSDDRDTWVRVGMALKSTGSASGYGLWNEWSKTSPKYNPDDMERRWATLKPNNITIASLFYDAKKYGWTTTYQDAQVVASSSIPVDYESIQKAKKEHQKQPFPQELLRPGGLVGDIIDCILSKSIVPQPVFALSAALCAVGALAGRKVQTETGIRTNIYCLNVGGSGSGKEAPRKTIKAIFEAAGCGEMSSTEDLASDAAIATRMNEVNSQIFLLDEIGRFIETTKRGATHLYNVVSVLLKMYSAADQVFHGKDYADKEKKIKIDQPNLCLMGTTVPDTLYKGLTYESATDGFLSRVLIFETDNNRPRKDRSKNILSKPPRELIEKVKKLYLKPVNMNASGNLEHLVPDPQVAPMTENAREMLLDFEDYIHDLRDTLANENRVDAVYNRVSQIAEQIALIIATGINIDDPVITGEEMSYGISLAKYLADQMLYIVENHMAKNDHEHEVKRILNIIRTSGVVSYAEISQHTQNLPGYVRNDALETLKESKQIAEHYVGTGEIVSRMFVAL